MTEFYQDQGDLNKSTRGHSYKDMPGSRLNPAEVGLVATINDMGVCMTAWYVC